MTDGKTVAIWGDAMVAALRRDTGPLVELLEHHNEITPDLMEFLAMLLKAKPRHRPRLPHKFKLLEDIAKRPAMLDAINDLKQRRACWRYSNKKPFPLKEQIRAVAQIYGVTEDALLNMDRRPSGKKVGG